MATPALRLEDCLECGLCVAACPVEGDFSGPASLLAAAVEREKHPERNGEMLDLAARPEGVESCERKFECAKACPQGLSPGRRIAELRRLLATRTG
jgi:succinate dehydrogenase / fumarate reductase iron-sulfur subunit